jgi:hypothetical protein
MQTAGTHPVHQVQEAHWSAHGHGCLHYGVTAFPGQGCPELYAMSGSHCQRIGQISECGKTRQQCVVVDGLYIFANMHTYG